MPKVTELASRTARIQTKACRLQHLSHWATLKIYCLSFCFTLPHSRCHFSGIGTTSRTSLSHQYWESSVTESGVMCPWLGAPHRQLHCPAQASSLAPPTSGPRRALTSLCLSVLGTCESRVQGRKQSHQQVRLLSSLFPIHEGMNASQAGRHFLLYPSEKPHQARLSSDSTSRHQAAEQHGRGHPHPALPCRSRANPWACHSRPLPGSSLPLGRPVLPLPHHLPSPKAPTSQCFSSSTNAW